MTEDEFQYYLLFLVNILYFKGEWTLEFDPSDTLEKDFYYSDSIHTKVDMMSISSANQYINTGDYQIAELPYGREKISFYALLPNKENHIDDFIENLDYKELKTNLDSMYKTKLNLSIPKFKSMFEYKIENLQDYGINLTRIEKVNQNSYINLDEKGTEAATVTTITPVESSSVEPPIPNFHANSPFIYLIRDNRSGAILFIGEYLFPQSITTDQLSL